MRQSYSKILISSKETAFACLVLFPKIILATNGTKDNTSVVYGLLIAVSLFHQGLEWDCGR